jgi:aminoglycoside 6'-N-acetyltransferase
MMLLALENCFENENVKAVLIDPLSSNTKAHKFYEKFGFEFLEEKVFGLDHCFVYKLSRAVWEKNVKNKF